MRFGGPVFAKWEGPEEWAREVRRLGYGAAYCPVGLEADDGTVRAFEQAAREADIVIAEVGAWSNPLSADEATRKAAVEKCQTALEMADRIGARCAVNIAGSRGEKWDGPDAGDLTPEAFEMIVASVREIIDAVEPKRSYYTLETMPWMYPDSTDSYLELVRAIDRPQFAVHFDAVNLVSSPQRYFATGALIREFAEKLGPLIRSCHAKDILLQPNLTTHLDEVRPGTGGLDFATLLRELSRLEADVPLLMEHLPSEEEYTLAAAHIRSVAGEIGVSLG